MAFKVSKRISTNIKGVLEIKEGRLFVQVEDVANPYDLAEFVREFDNLEVRISVTHSEEEA